MPSSRRPARRLRESLARIVDPSWVARVGREGGTSWPHSPIDPTSLLELDVDRDRVCTVYVLWGWLADVSLSLSLSLSPPRVQRDAGPSKIAAAKRPRRMGRVVSHSTDLDTQ